MLPALLSACHSGRWAYCMCSKDSFVQVTLGDRVLPTSLVPLPALVPVVHPLGCLSPAACCLVSFLGALLLNISSSFLFLVAEHWCLIFLEDRACGLSAKSHRKGAPLAGVCGQLMLGPHGLFIQEPGVRSPAWTMTPRAFPAYRHAHLPHGRV